MRWAASPRDSNPICNRFRNRAPKALPPLLLLPAVPLLLLRRPRHRYRQQSRQPLQALVVAVDAPELAPLPHVLWPLPSPFALEALHGVVVALRVL